MPPWHPAVQDNANYDANLNRHGHGLFYSNNNGIRVRHHNYCVVRRL